MNKKYYSIENAVNNVSKKFALGLKESFREENQEGEFFFELSNFEK